MTAVAWTHAFIDVPRDRVDAAKAFWAAVTGWEPGPPWAGHPEFVSLAPSDGGTPYLHVQAVDAAPRVHLDIAGDLDRQSERLAELGAHRGQRHDGWQVLSSPAGLPFCVCPDRPPYKRPAAVRWPGGHRSRLVQLCVDVSAARADDDCTFWRAATGWADELVDAPEFRRLAHRVESPPQLLVQRVDEDRSTSAGAHLDLGTDDIPAEVARLQALGARVLWPGRGFTALEDPTGLPFCVTGIDPDR